MEKIAKRYLWAEGVIFLGIFLSGLIDPSFWFWGVYYIGVAVNLGGLIASILWCVANKRLGKSVAGPVTALLINIAIILFVIGFLFVLISDGANFMM